MRYCLSDLILAILASPVLAADPTSLQKAWNVEDAGTPDPDVQWEI
jgi:hypothetical protein